MSQQNITQKGVYYRDHLMLTLHMPRDLVCTDPAWDGDALKFTILEPVGGEGEFQAICEIRRTPTCEVTASEVPSKVTLVNRMKDWKGNRQVIYIKRITDGVYIVSDKPIE